MGALRRAAPSRVVPHRYDDAGRVLVPAFDEVSNGDPWARLEPLVDVLRKLPRGISGAPYAWVEHEENPVTRDGSWVLGLDVPFDWEWARDRVVLPEDVVVEPAPAGHGYGQVRTARGDCTVTSSWDPDGETWRAAGWVQGQPYDGPRPAPRRRWWSR